MTVLFPFCDMCLKINLHYLFLKREKDFYLRNARENPLRPLTSYLAYIAPKVNRLNGERFNIYQFQRNRKRGFVNKIFRSKQCCLCVEERLVKPYLMNKGIVLTIVVMVLSSAVL